MVLKGRGGRSGLHAGCQSQARFQSCSLQWLLQTPWSHVSMEQNTYLTIISIMMMIMITIMMTIVMHADTTHSVSVHVLAVNV